MTIRSGPAGARAVSVVKGGQIERRAVRVGSDMAGQSEILEGVAEGDSVIVSGTSLIREGAKARVVAPLSDQVAGEQAGRLHVDQHP